MTEGISCGDINPIYHMVQVVTKPYNKHKVSYAHSKKKNRTYRIWRIPKAMNIKNDKLCVGKRPTETPAGGSR